MRIHCLRHVPFEDEAAIGDWARERGHTLTHTNMHENPALPAEDAFDWLVVMGGPMSVGDTTQYPWLLAEKTFIARAVGNGRLVLGICLGAQLIAAALGAQVTRNRHKEIGWHPVALTTEGRDQAVFAGFPDIFPAFHWHGDTFALPEGAVHAARSEGCVNQAFVYKDRVVGLQFHLETTAKGMDKLIKHCKDDITPGPHVQDAKIMRAGSDALAMLGPLAERLLDNMAGLAE